MKGIRTAIGVGQVFTILLLASLCSAAAAANEQTPDSRVIAQLTKILQECRQPLQVNPSAMCSGLVALAAGTEHETQRRYAEAVRTYQDGLQDAALRRNRGEGASSLTERLRTQLQCGFITASLANGDPEPLRHAMSEVEQRALDRARYALSKDCLLLIQLFTIGDPAGLQAILRSMQTYNESRRPLVPLLAPFTAIDSFVDGVVIDILQGWSSLQSRNRVTTSHLQTHLESLYQSPVTKAMLWGGGVTGLYRNERAAALALGGYGYALLGRHGLAGQFLSEAVAISGQCELEPTSWFTSSMTRVAYAEAFLLPMQKFDESLRLLGEARECYARLHQMHPAFRGRSTQGLFGYPELVTAKALFLRGSPPTEILDALFAAADQMGSVTPRQFVIDVVHYSVTACALDWAACPQQRVVELLRSASDLLRDYQGYEIWKLWHAHSLLLEQASDWAGALEATERAILALDGFAAPGFLQQYTFMEDKWLAYQRAVRLALHDPNASRTDKVNGAINAYKARAAALASEATPESPTLTVAEVQKVLQPGEAVLNYFYDKDGLIVVVITASTSTVQTVAVAPTELESLIHSYRKDVSSTGALSASSSGAGEQLHTLLLEPVRSSLTEVEQLYVSPHRQLHYVPWNALPTMDSGKALLAKSRVSILAATAVPPRLHGTTNPNSDEFCGTVIVGENVDATLLDPIHLGSCWKVVAGASATISEALAALNRSQPIVFLAHGALTSHDRRYEGLRLAGGELLTVDHIAQLQNVAAPMVVLTSCHSGEEVRYSELPVEVVRARYPEATDLIQFYRVFLARGARVVLSAVQEVPYAGSIELVRALAAKLSAEDAEPSIAAHEALRQLQQQDSPPSTWGSYLLVR